MSVDGAAVDGQSVAVGQAADALGTAFATFQLYPRPADQPIFDRCLAALAPPDQLPLRIEVGPGHFVWEGAPLPASRDGTARLAKLLFVHDVGALEIRAGVKPADLVRIFEIVSGNEAEVQRAGGAENVVAGEGIESIRLLHRTELVEGSALLPVETEEDALLASADDPDVFAADLMHAAGDDPDTLAEQFRAWYVSAYADGGADGTRSREETVRAFVEAFFYLARDFQVPLLTAFLNERQVEPCQVFLDQFSGHELAELSPHLSPEAQEMLNEYARIASHGSDARPEELLALLQSESEVREARSAVARRVQHVLREDRATGSDSDWLRQIKDQASAALPVESGVGRVVLRRLFAIEDRDPRYRRLCRIWQGRVGAAVRDGDVEEALEWIRAVQDDPSYPPERTEQVGRALADMATAELLEDLVDAMDEPEAVASATELLMLWGSEVVHKLAEQLAAEQDPRRRRTLITALAALARIEPAPLLSYLVDERWYVLRNLAVILGRSGRSEVAGSVRVLSRHDDYRVRVEALRALAPLLGPGSLGPTIEALSDPHPRVRQAALTLLRSIYGEEVDTALLAALDAAREPEEIERLIAALSDRGAPMRAQLKRLADRKIAFSLAWRSKREMAKRALERAS